MKKIDESSYAMEKGKGKSMKKLAAVAAIVCLTVAGLVVAGCGGGGGGGFSSLTGTAALTLQVHLPDVVSNTASKTQGGATAQMGTTARGGGIILEQTAPSVEDISSVTVILSGLRYKTIRKSFPVVNGRGSIIMDGLRPARSILLKLIVFSESSVPLYAAYSTVTLKSGENTRAELTLEPTTPTAIVLTSFGYTTGSNLDLSWLESAEPYFASYKLYQSTQPGVTEDDTLIDTITARSTITRRVTGLEYGTTYYFKLYVSTLAEWSTPSNELSITIIDPDPVVTIPDANLQAAVRDALVLPTGDLQVSHMAVLSDLQAPSSGITDLTGLQYCTSLVNLDLTDNQITDISALQFCTQLVSIDLSHNQIEDISPLVDNTGLGSWNAIDLSDNSLDEGDLDDVQALLDRDAAVIHTIGDTLVTLNDAALEQELRDTLHLPTQDLYASDLGVLTSLAATDAGIADLTGFEYCTAMVGLDLSGNAITDLTPLGSCVYLLALDLSENQITDVSALQSCTELSTLDLSDNLIDNITPLVNNTGLGTGDTVNLVNNSLDEDDLADMQVLIDRGAVVLNDVGGSGTPVIFPDANLQTAIRDEINKPTGDILDTDLLAMSSLGAISAGVTDLTGMEYCLGLTVADFRSNQITDISPLGGLTGLTGLILTNNDITDISPLQNLTNMMILNLSGNTISDISSLVANTGIDDGDIVHLGSTGLDLADMPDIQTLENRGVVVIHTIAGDLVVTFPDANLEAKVREALPKPTGDLMASELAGLNYLDASASSIADLTGLENCLSMTTLDLSDNQVTDISALESLTVLLLLDLGNNQVSDITPLINNNGLGIGATVTLTGNSLDSDDLPDILTLQDRGVTVVHDVSGGVLAVTFNDSNLEQVVRDTLSKPTGDILQSEMAAMVTLDASSAAITDLTGLEYCVLLAICNLSDNQITDIDPLQHCTALAILDLSENQIDDITPLVDNTGIDSGDTVDLSTNSLDAGDLPDVQTLEGRGVVVTDDLGNLAVTFSDANFEQAVRDAISKPTGDVLHSDLEALTSLNANELSIADLTGLEHCTALTHLGLADNQLTDISQVQYCTVLTNLNLGTNEIVDISPLQHCTALTTLLANKNQITDITSLGTCTALTSLILDENQISSINPLSTCTALTTLTLSHNQVGSISALASCPALHILELSENQISDLSPLTGLTALSFLALGDNQIASITSLANLVALEVLDLGYNQVTDITSLGNLVSLLALGLGDNQITDISPLGNLVLLEDVELGGNTISTITTLQGLITLESVGLSDNLITDITALVNNVGLDTGDTVGLTGNPLDGGAMDDIQVLEARGITVLYDTP